MVILQRHPAPVETYEQLLEIAQLYRELYEFRMHDEQDVLQHVINVNDRMQELIFKGHPGFSTEQAKYETLQRTLLEPFRDVLDFIWEVLDGIPKYYSEIVTIFIKNCRQVQYLATLSRTKLPLNVAKKIVELASEEPLPDLHFSFPVPKRFRSSRVEGPNKWL